MTRAAPPSREVVAQAQAGQEPERTAVLQYLYGLVLRHVGFLTGFGPDAEDIAQDALIQIHAGLPRFAFRSTVKTWALAIATRTARRAMRRAAAHGARVDGERDVEACYGPIDRDARDQLNELCTHLGRIDAKKREAFVLMDILGLTAQEAGKALGTFANTAASRCRHARAELDALYSAATSPSDPNEPARFDEYWPVHASRGTSGRP